MTDHAASGNASVQKAVRREVNDRVYEIGVEHRIDASEFLCECSVPDCPALVAVAHDVYISLRRARTPILAPGHVA